MEPQVKELLRRNEARIADERRFHNRRVARALVAHIEHATQMREDEAPLSSRLRAHGSGRYIVAALCFFGAMTVTTAVIMAVFG